MPAVSINTNSSSLNVNGTWIESIVVPGISETINLSCLVYWLINVDLPAFGRPMTAIFVPDISIAGVSSRLSAR